MTDLSAEARALADYRPTHKVRFVTAASLFDGHDASINIMRRILQQSGCEVIHLGHNRSVEEIVTAALQEDAQGIAVSSYQGGHVEFFHRRPNELRTREALDRETEVLGVGDRETPVDVLLALVLEEEAKLRNRFRWLDEDGRAADHRSGHGARREKPSISADKPPDHGHLVERDVEPVRRPGIGRDDRRTRRDRRADRALACAAVRRPRP